MPKISANLGFLWNELELPSAIRSAKEAGFDAVECHWPYETDASLVNEALSETGLPMIGINTKRGNVPAGEAGVAAMPGREGEAREYIDEAIAYAALVGCGNIHVMAGITDHGDDAELTFRDNLQYACSKARPHGIQILIEPINRIDIPDYHLQTLEQAMKTLKAIDRFNLKIMFDCYHMQIMGGNLISRFKDHQDHIGHIQIAAVPDRGEPNEGEIDFRWLLQQFDECGWEGFIGAEYKPRTNMQEGLGWLEMIR